MSLQGIFDPVVMAYFENKFGGDGGSSARVAYEKDVNFWDYDGTLLYSYTLAEARALTGLPPVPDRNKQLVNGSWNWTLEEVNTLERGADIGAVYETKDDAVYIGLDIISSNNCTIVLNFSGIASIDWGDGTTLDGASSGVSHTYAEIGKYEIKMLGVTHIGGGTSSTQIVSGEGRKNVVYVYCNGTKCGVKDYCFFGLYALETVAVKGSSSRYMFNDSRKLRFFTTNDGEVKYGQFKNCTGLSLVCLPKAENYIHGEGYRGCSSLRRLPNASRIFADGGYQCASCNSVNEVNIAAYGTTAAAHSCFSARKITIHEGVTTIQDQSFYNCIAADIVSVASTVTSIGAQAFQYCGARLLKFLSATPPTVANANAFTSIPADCVVEVPAASLTAYQNATNYASIAAQMVGV